MADTGSGIQEQIDVLVNLLLQKEQGDAVQQQIAEILSKAGEQAAQVYAAALMRAVRQVTDERAKIEQDAGTTVKSAKSVTSQADTDAREQDRKRLRAMQMISRASSATAGLLTTLTKGSLGLLEEIYNKLKSASPLLQAIESLFNLAMTLFFMPLGNKFGEILIPAMIDLVDSVIAMWDAFEGKTLGEMFTYAIEYGIRLLATFFNQIGDILISTGDKTLSAVGGLLKSIANFLQTSGVNLFNKIISLVTWVVDHIGTLVTLIMAFKAIHVSLMLAQIAATMASSIWAPVLGVVAAGVAVGGIGLGLYAGSVMGYAEGGHVNATPGGQLAVIGEGGEGEWIIPDSKMDAIGSKTYNTFNFSGLAMPDFERAVEDIISRQVSRSNLRGAF